MVCMLSRLSLGQKSELSVTFIKADIRPKVKFQKFNFFITVCIGPETPCTSILSGLNVV
jgi:hypothetical protein